LLTKKIMEDGGGKIKAQKKEILIYEEVLL
jgi:hypothetical protein